jgi:hypothetical protein
MCIIYNNIYLPGLVFNNVETLKTFLWVMSLNFMIYCL